MGISKQKFREYIEGFDFTRLFNQLGWNYIKEENPVKIKDQLYMLKSAAEKSGFRILVCEAGEGERIPDYSTRVRIDRAVSRLYREHLIIFHDQARTYQLWQLVIRTPGMPDRPTQTEWHRGQAPELLYQKASGLFFTLEEEDQITIVDVTQRMAENFHQNRDKVTKKFYEGFRKEYKAFLGFIKGIADHANQEWYASLMLNRLMFCYFIQKQGFLDENKNYLHDKLKACQEKKGKNHFYSFYRDFLLALFHKGLGAPARSQELQVELGRIPYLNGGLFDEHQLERDYKGISIDDKAFESVFKFFDQYNWHLDTRKSASGKDIDPDVIGYIFEKYINDRAQMGAYYTKEDITDYISKNCIIPYLYDETERKYRKAFRPSGEIWPMLQDSGDTYVYDAVKHGIDPDNVWGDLPGDVKAGLDPDQPDLVEKRRCWNRPVPAEAALPTEIWREVIERRKRYIEVTDRIKSGAITEINDFITYNLNIRQFTADVLTNTDDPELIRHFYQALNKVTILDPTCGSGAFLFASMNILEPLYDICLLRMADFVTAAPGKHRHFEETLALVKAPEHPNRKYFIYKSIILQNIYGVDIMHEAVEIAKLRLFLKLVATVDPDYRKPNLGLEPLPDIDYNIRAGNTLVGYASEAEIEEAISSRLDFDNDMEKIKERCDIVARAFTRYKEIQLSYADNYEQFIRAKSELEKRLQALNTDLNELMHKQNANQKFNAWRKSHKPFHWFSEFYEIIHNNGGFDVIVGNPPYVEYSQLTKPYPIDNYSTRSCGNLYALVTERSTELLKYNSYIGMIVQLPMICTDRMIPLQNHLKTHYSVIYLSSYDDRPGKLFDGLEHIRATIFISKKSVKECQIIGVTKYHRWYTDARPALFHSIQYFLSSQETTGTIPKIGCSLHEDILNKLSQHSSIGCYLDSAKDSSYSVYYHNAPQYWIRATTFVPYFWNERDGERPSLQIKTLLFEGKDIAASINAVLNSTLFYIWFTTLSDCRHLNMREIEKFPIGITEMNCKDIKILTIFNAELMGSYLMFRERKYTSYKTTGKVEYDEFYPKKSKPIIDEIDTVLAKHYGFTPEELDFIINYDIKYRMGKELEEEEDKA